MALLRAQSLHLPTHSVSVTSFSSSRAHLFSAHNVRSSIPVARSSSSAITHQMLHVHRNLFSTLAQTPTSTATAKDRVSRIADFKNKNTTPPAILYMDVVRKMIDNGDWQQLDKYFTEMQQEYTPHIMLFHLVLDACGSASHLEQMLAYFEQMRQKKLTPTHETYQIIWKHLPHSTKEELEQSAHVKMLSNAMRQDLHAFCERQDMQNLISLSVFMLKCGIEPSFNLLFRTFERGDIKHIEDWFQALTVINKDDVGFPLYSKLLAWLVPFSTKARHFDFTLHLLEEVVKKNILHGDAAACFHVVLRDVVEHGTNEQTKKCIDLILQNSSDIQLSDFAHNVIIRHVATSGDIEEMMRLFAQYKAIYQPPSSFVYASLMQGFGTAKNPQRAMELLDQMDQDNIVPNLYAFNAFLSYVAPHDTTTIAVILERMKKAKLIPTATTYYGIINAFAVNNDEANTMYNMEQMKKQRMRPSKHVFKVIAEMYERMGDRHMMRKYLGLMERYSQPPARQQQRPQQQQQQQLPKQQSQQTQQQQIPKSSTTIHSSQTVQLDKQQLINNNNNNTENSKGDQANSNAEDLVKKEQERLQKMSAAELQAEFAEKLLKANPEELQQKLLAFFKQQVTS